jgi:hypothetical protein
LALGAILERRNGNRRMETPLYESHHEKYTFGVVVNGFDLKRA